MADLPDYLVASLCHPLNPGLPHGILNKMPIGPHFKGGVMGISGRDPPKSDERKISRKN
jgi:hypothetical protein